ncbi:uncharacterized protein LOC129611763 [Condylostylus longicornis]|uniref:uncharacterized protein LOC129611763 n=1 Tax=Condylostylus longicornis TaxID=2530218 RepID=UPI00244E4006|nr:uncharacterized protein LOC129611763 [Condylostylus longicornis]
MDSFKKLISDVIRNGEKQNYEELKKIILKTPQGKILETIKYSVREGGVNFWNYLLKGFALCSNNESCNQRRFECVEMFLRELSITELSYKQTYDLITRLCGELLFFRNSQLLTIIEICNDSIRFGDSKLVWWKDIFPEALALICNQEKLEVDGVSMSGIEYKNNMVKFLFSMKWNLSTLTALANMFVELKLDENEIVNALSKFCKYLQKVSPAELPPLAFQLFCMCQTASHLIIPILALQKYFHHYYYKKLFTDLESEASGLDSIDLYAEKDLREAEETILHHLNFCTRFRISEEEVCVILRNLTSCPEIILRPFFLSAVISMSKSNRDPDCWILSSPLLIFLKNVIRKNEEQIELSKSSTWCDDTFHVQAKNMQQIFSVLIDQNKDGKDVITPGLVNLAFILLRAKNHKKLSVLSTSFLAQFIKKRFIFGHGIVKNLANWMLAEQDCERYSECLTILAHSDTYTVSESFQIIKNVLDFFLWIPGKNAMRMMSFILPLMKISQPIRDAFIDTMKKAINSKDHETCLLGVYGFCSLLKQLNNNNSQRAGGNGSFLFTQQCISGYSLMTQSCLSSRSNSQRHFDILVLEIVGCLRKCFSASVEIKETLYENFGRAVLLNPKLAPHFLEFIDNHFRGYFKVDESETVIRWEKIVYQEQECETIKICDNIGCLTILVSSIVLICEKNDIVHNSVVMKSIIKTVAERIISKDFKLIENINNSDTFALYLAIQQINFLEALMYYLLWTSKITNNNVTQIQKLFGEHQRIKNLVEQSSLKGKKIKDQNEKNETNLINNKHIKKSTKSSIKLKNIWDLLTLERFLKLLHDDMVPFADSVSTTFLKSNTAFVQYILKVTASYLEELRSQPDYKQIKLSIRIFKQVCVVTRVIYERCIKNLQNLWRNFDVESAYLAVECLKESLLTTKKLYSTKFEQFLKEVDLLFFSDEKNKIYNIIQNILEETTNEKEDIGEEFSQKISSSLLQCLEVLHSFISAGTSLALESFDWLYGFCKKYEINQESSLIYKLLFTMRLKSHSGAFFDLIASHLGKVMGVISETELTTPQSEFKALNGTSFTSCYIYLLQSLQQQLEFIDFFIFKIKSSFCNLKFVSEDDQEICGINLKTMERSVCTQFIHITNCLVQMTNIDTPLGECMNNLVRVLIQFYVSLNNLTKHLMLQHSRLAVSFQNIKYDQVVRLAGKPLASRIYALIINIDEKILYSLDEKKNKKNPTADGAKVLRETKHLPKLILRMETFNKYVMFLSKKTGNDITHFLHIGTVRDFRIQTKNLKDAIHESLDHSSQIEDLLDDQNDNNTEIIDSERDSNNDEKSSGSDDELSAAKTVASKKSVGKPNKSKKVDSEKRKIVSTRSSTQRKSQAGKDISIMEETPVMGFLNEEESDENAGLQFLQNVAKITEKGRKRKSLNSNLNEKQENKKRKTALKKN